MLFQWRRGPAGVETERNERLLTRVEAQVDTQLREPPPAPANEGDAAAAEAQERRREYLQPDDLEPFAFALSDADETASEDAALETQSG